MSEQRHLRVVVLGGGNGISTLLRGLALWKAADRAIEITAIVATADDGGSSGRLRRQRGGLPYGDLRNCLQALAADPSGSSARLFAHRFAGAGELAGHALGNLVLAALAEQEGCCLRGLERAGKLIGACGRVLPVSLDNVDLHGETADRRRLSGESALGNAGCALRRVWLEPDPVRPAPGVLEAVESADLLVIGPGSLFTSLLAVLLVKGVADAIRGSGAQTVLVANLMTQPAETLGMDLESHLRALDDHVGPGLVGHVLHHCRSLPAERLRAYRAQRAEPIVAPAVWSRPERLVGEDLATQTGKIRHEPDRLVAALCRLAESAGLGRVEGRWPRIGSVGAVEKLA